MKKNKKNNLRNKIYRQTPGLLFLLVHLLTVSMTYAAVSTKLLTTDKLSILFQSKGGNPVSCYAFYSPNTNKILETSFFDNPESTSIGIVIQDQPKLTKRINVLPYSFNVKNTESQTILECLSDPLEDDIYLKKTYTLSKKHFLLTVKIEFLGAGAVDFVNSRNIGIYLKYGKKFIPPQAEGFTGTYERVSTIGVNQKKTLSLTHKNIQKIYSVHKARWLGFRNRFWALLVKPDSKYTATIFAQNSTKKTLNIFPTTQSTTIKYTLFAGPISYGVLKERDVSLTQLLFTGLWFWMRWLCLGFLFLFDFLLIVIKSYGMAIVLLSLCVKIILLPITKKAEKWQQSVNEKKTLLAPLLKDITTHFKGEQQNQKILELYRSKNIHPLYTIKSLYGCMIQIPFFIAAYHMLHENIMLKNSTFLWIQDLSQPDRLARLPFDVPFFGSMFHVLPFLMTLLTIVSSWQFNDGSLSKDLLKTQRRNLFLMAFAFFILFYTFPSGMVLYWTSNNFFILLKNLSGKYVKTGFIYRKPFKKLGKWI